MTNELRAIAEAAPERIWLLDWPDASATWCADPDPDGEHFDSVEYVRADRLAALEAGEARVGVPTALAEQACALSKTGSTVTIECDDADEANELFDWIARTALANPTPTPKDQA